MFKFINKKGFSIVEVLIAVAIMVVITGIFLNLLFTGYKARNTSRERLQMLAYSTSIVDEIKAYQYDWKNFAGLKARLLNEGYIETINNAFCKVASDSLGISYDIKLYIEKDKGIDKLIQISIEVKPLNSYVNPIKMSVRLREV
ncbi:MAG TPA: type II secretion system protein [Clostridiales bacterium]|nr:type II secretion system protein [Clostridiales bacterium]